MLCPNNHPHCPGPAGYDVDSLDSGVCGACEIEAMCAEATAAPVANRHGLLACDHSACRPSRPAVSGGRCQFHQDFAEG